MALLLSARSDSSLPAFVITCDWMHELSLAMDRTSVFYYLILSLSFIYLFFFLFRFQTKVYTFTNNYQFSLLNLFYRVHATCLCCPASWISILSFFLSLPFDSQHRFLSFLSFRHVLKVYLFLSSFVAAFLQCHFFI